MTKKEFLNKYMKFAMADKKVQKAIAATDSRKQRLILVSILRDYLEKAYDRAVEDYYKRGRLKRGVSILLRILGFGADLVGTYAFWTLDGAGFGAKLLGLGLKSAADVFEGGHYFRKNRPLDRPARRMPSSQALAEGVITRVLAYLPYGVGEVADLLRGTLKFDGAMNKAAIRQAKKDFLENLEKHRRAKDA